MLHAEMFEDVAAILLGHLGIETDVGDKFGQVKEFADHVVMRGVDFIELRLDSSESWGLEGGGRGRGSWGDGLGLWPSEKDFSAW